MIQTKVEREIHDFIIINGRECSAIIMHPKTCRELCEEMTCSFQTEINIDIKNVM